MTPPAPAAAIEAAVREEWGRLLSALIAHLGDFQLAEDCLQDALESALVHWQRNGLPQNRRAWLLQTARRKAIDRIRRDINFRKKQAEYGQLIELDNAEQDGDPNSIPDERLRLIFTCCHPAIDEKIRVALTLHTMGGLTTREIARAFLVSEDAMAQRLARAKRKIKKALIPYEVPDDDAWPERLESVLQVLYFIFNEGYAATAGDVQVRTDLCDEAIHLTRVVQALRPEEPEIAGLLALMLLHDSRRSARSDGDGPIILLDRQDRSMWDHDKIAEGIALIERTLAKGRPGPYQIQAAISAVHAEAGRFGDTDWRQIALLYDALYKLQPNPVVALNRLVAVSYADGPHGALPELESLQDALQNYQPYYVTKADLLRRAGRTGDAQAAYGRAIELTSHPKEKAFLQSRLDNLPEN